MRKPAKQPTTPPPGAAFADLARAIADAHNAGQPITEPLYELARLRQQEQAKQKP